MFVMRLFRKYFSLIRDSISTTVHVIDCYLLFFFSTSKFDFISHFLDFPHSFSFQINFQSLLSTILLPLFVCPFYYFSNYILSVNSIYVFWRLVFSHLYIHVSPNWCIMKTWHSYKRYRSHKLVPAQGTNFILLNFSSLFRNPLAVHYIVSLVKSMFSSLAESKWFSRFFIHSLHTMNWTQINWEQKS